MVAAGRGDAKSGEIGASRPTLVFHSMTARPPPGGARQDFAMLSSN
jgi:hypothetical protein